MRGILDKEFLFVVGAPRSGTTWLHRMLSQHPDVAAMPHELTLFSSYLAPLAERFAQESRHRDLGDWEQGLPLLFSQQEFDHALARIAEETYARLLDRHPTASHILDKHPAYALHMPLIDKLLPKSRFLHIVRDGREVAVSMMSAKKRIGFGAAEIAGAAKAWATHVRAAQDMGRELGPDRYLEVTYEDLMERTHEVLSEIFRFAGLPLSGTAIADIAAEHAISKKQVSRGDASLNALRKTPGAIWRTKLSLVQRWTMDRMVGDLLLKLGYARPGWWMVHPGDGMRITVRQLVLRLRLTLRSGLHIWCTPLVKRVVH